MRYHKQAQPFDIAFICLCLSAITTITTTSRYYCCLLNVKNICWVTYKWFLMILISIWISKYTKDYRLYAKRSMDFRKIVEKIKQKEVWKNRLCFSFDQFGLRFRFNVSQFCSSSVRSIFKSFVYNVVYYVYPEFVREETTRQQKLLKNSSKGRFNICISEKYVRTVDEWVRERCSNSVVL